MKEKEKAKKINGKVAIDDYMAAAQFFFDYECYHDCIVTNGQYIESTNDYGYKPANGPAITLCLGHYDPSCQKTTSPSGWSAW